MIFDRSISESIGREDRSIVKEMAMSIKRVVPIVSVSQSQLRDDVVERALSAGFNINEINTLEKQIAYRKAYNQRPNVVEKRKLYTHARYVRLKALKNILAQQV